MAERVGKSELLDGIVADRARFDATLERVPADRLAEPLLPGGWSVKDVLAHIAWGEREAIGVVRARALVGSELWNVSEDERNEAVVRASRSVGLDEIERGYRTTFADYLDALDGLSDEELNDPTRFAGLTDRIPGWPPWRVLYDPSHYEEHRRTIEAHALDTG